MCFYFDRVFEQQRKQARFCRPVEGPERGMFVHKFEGKAGRLRSDARE